MAEVDRKVKKMLFNPRKDGTWPPPGVFIPEFDPVLSADSWFARATNVAATLGTVATSRTLFAYGFLIANVSTTEASVSILEGATVKLEFNIIGTDIIQIPEGPDPRAPICRFNALAPIQIVSSSPGAAAATVKVTMSFWDAEIR